MGTWNWLWAAAVTALVAACGGGSGGPSAPPAQPTIVSFSADKPAFLMGEAAQLTPVFAGGNGRIEPGVGPVQSGVAIATPPLQGDVTYQLIVEAAGKPTATRALSLPVNYRDRFVDAGRFDSMFHSAVELPDGGVLIVGGYRGGNVNSSAIDRFDPVTRTFRQVGELAAGRAQPRLVVLGDGRVLIAGGATSVASGVTYELFDPQTGQVSPAGVPVRNRLGHTATRLLDGRVFIAGGVEQSGAEIWDPATLSSRPVVARMHNPREWHTATLLADGRVLLVGGYTMANAYWLAEVFDPRTEQFTAVGEPRFTPQVETLGLHNAHRLADGSVLIAGGELFNPAVVEDSRPTAAVLRFDPATSEFTSLPGLLVPRSLMTSVALPDDRLVMIGGLDAGNEATATGEVYRPGRAGAPTALLDGGRAWHTVSRLPGGRLLVVGGMAPNGSSISSALIYE